jgi:hypothetical protein
MLHILPAADHAVLHRIVDLQHGSELARIIPHHQVLHLHQEGVPYRFFYNTAAPDRFDFDPDTVFLRRWILPTSELVNFCVNSVADLFKTYGSTIPMPFNDT